MHHALFCRGLDILKSGAEVTRSLYQTKVPIPTSHFCPLYYQQYTVHNWDIIFSKTLCFIMRSINSRLFASSHAHALLLCVLAIGVSCFLFFPLSASAATITAASCNASDVQTALNSVTAATTQVNIPAGTCHWTQTISYTVPSGSTNLTILGAGNLNTTGGGDATVLLDDASGNTAILNITTAGATSKFRMAGITIQSGTGSARDHSDLTLSGNSQNVRLDHMHFVTSGAVTVGVWFWGAVYGVVDHSILSGKELARCRTLRLGPFPAPPHQNCS